MPNLKPFPENYRFKWNCLNIFFSLFCIFDLSFFLRNDERKSYENIHWRWKRFARHVRLVGMNEETSVSWRLLVRRSKLLWVYKHTHTLTNMHAKRFCKENIKTIPRVCMLNPFLSTLPTILGLTLPTMEKTYQLAYCITYMYIYIYTYIQVGGPLEANTCVVSRVSSQLSSNNSNLKQKNWAIQKKVSKKKREDIQKR